MISLVAAGLTEFELGEYRTHPHYTAPETLSGSGVLSKEADVFSFAMVIVEARRECLSWVDCWLISSSPPTIGFQS